MIEPANLTDKQFFDLVHNEAQRRRRFMSQNDPIDDAKKRSLWLDMLDCEFYAMKVVEQL
jgi:hypothetical protein